MLNLAYTAKGQYGSVATPRENHTEEPAQPSIETCHIQHFHVRAGNQP